MRHQRPIPAAALLATLFGSAACAQSPAADPHPSAGEAAATITAETMDEWISYFASDELAGRGTPSPGLEAAATRIAEEYRRFRIEPGAGGDSYLQRFPLVCPRPADGAGSASAPRCRLGDDAPRNGGSRYERAEPPNVVGILRGTDPELRDEYVILSAHLDHLGVGAPVRGDSIYNGADDNGSGTSALVEVARALSLLGAEGPRRSVVFLHVSGEEHGLLGSTWYSDHPTVDLDAVVANLNVDMISSDLHRDTVVVIGKRYSSLGPLVDGVNDAHPDLGLVSSDDIWPEERFFFRSDHFNFARKEIPALFFFTGVHRCYHQPCDEPDSVDPDKAARIARLLFHSVLEIADRNERPVWDREGLEEVRELVGQ